MRYSPGAQTPALAAGENEFQEVKKSTPFFSPATKTRSRFAFIAYRPTNVYLISSLFLKRTRLYSSAFRLTSPPIASSQLISAANANNFYRSLVKRNTTSENGPSTKYSGATRFVPPGKIRHYAITFLNPP
jgi:hypothetical protein